jgi:hypothetical protein
MQAEGRLRELDQSLIGVNAQGGITFLGQGVSLLKVGFGYCHTYLGNWVRGVAIKFISLRVNSTFTAPSALFK